MKGFLTGMGWMTTGGAGRGKTGEMFAPTGGALPSFSGDDFACIKSRRFGRMDTYSKVGLAAIAMALADADLSEWETKRPIGIITATESGCLATDMDYFDTVVKYGGKLASPNLFAYTLPNAFIGEAGILFGLSGMGIAVNVEESQGASLLGIALGSLTWGDDDIMLAGICELPAAAPSAPPADAPAFGVFAVLEKNRREGITPYGHVAEDKGKYSFNGKQIETFVDLITTAISSQQRENP